MAVSVERSWGKTVLVGVVFLVSFTSLEVVRRIPGYVEWFRGGPELWWWVENATRPLIPILIGLIALHGRSPRRWAAALGLDRPFFPALGLAVGLCVPLLVIPLLWGVTPNTDLGVREQLFGALIWPFAEEVNFRGFAFGHIYAYTGSGFWPAGLATSALFGFAHMTNAAAAGLELGGQLANAGIVGVSALGLAWMYCRWGRNLWLVFLLHAIGNFGGALYMSGDVAVGDRLFLSLLAGTLLMAIGVTLVRERYSWSRQLWLSVAGVEELVIDA